MTGVSPVARFRWLGFFDQRGALGRSVIPSLTPFVASCPMCRFIRQLEVLDREAQWMMVERKIVPISTGKSESHALDIRHARTLVACSWVSPRRRPMPHFAWFQREGSANALRSEQPLVLVTMMPIRILPTSVIDVLGPETAVRV